MQSSQIFADESTAAVSSGEGATPQETGKSLLGLVTLSRNTAEEAAIVHPDDLLKGVISRQTLRMLLSVLRTRDAATMRHCRRVATLAAGLSRKLGWEPKDQKILEVAALLHDIGKVGIPDNILFKPGRLNSDESAMMALHHDMGVDLLQTCRVDNRVIRFIAEGAARQDDDAGFATPVSDMQQGARILAVADAYDSLNHDQVFREGKPHDEILKILMKQSGTRFDGNVVCTLARWIEQDGIPAGLEEGSAESAIPGPASDSQEAQEAAFLMQIFNNLYTLEGLYDGFYVLDNERRFILWNSGMARILQRPPEEILGQQWGPTLLGYTGELGQPLGEGEVPLDQAQATGRLRLSTVRMRRKDDTWANVEVQAVPIFDQHGKQQGMAEFLKDTQRPQAMPSDYRELKLAASRDALTSVANRAELESQLNLLLDHWRDSEDAEPFSVIFLDVDFFKNINDTFGHTVGDQVLIDMARLLQQESYSGELVARYGGEEFVILCPATHLDQAIRRAERIRTSLSETRIGGIGNYRVTASFGVTQVERQDSPATVIERADKALYAAKDSGRNKTCSLSSNEENAVSDESTKDDSDDPFIFTTKFQACLAADMIVYKLGGLVRDEKAHLSDATPTSATVRLGSAGLLRMWGSSPARQAVEITFNFDGLNAPNSGRRTSAPHIDVRLRIRPIGSIRDPEVFKRRAIQVVKLIRSYFAAD